MSVSLKPDEIFLKFLLSHAAVNPEARVYFLRILTMRGAGALVPDSQIQSNLQSPHTNNF